VAKVGGPAAGTAAAVSSVKVTSRMWWCASMLQCSRTRRARFVRGGLGAGQARDGVDGLRGDLAGGCVLPPAVILNGLAGAGEIQALDVRKS